MRGNEIFAEDLFRLPSIVFSVFESLTGRDGFDGCTGFPEWATSLEENRFPATTLFGVAKTLLTFFRICAIEDLNGA